MTIGVAVAVAANPAANTGRNSAGLSRFQPLLREMASSRLAYSLGAVKNVVRVVGHARFHFVFDGELERADFRFYHAESPARELGLDLPVHAVGGAPATDRPVSRSETLRMAFVRVQHALALHFGGVGGQHRRNLRVLKKIHQRGKRHRRASTLNRQRQAALLRAEPAGVGRGDGGCGAGLRPDW